jgi:hypothetical protein
MSAENLLTLIHVLLFCYWLGGDIGVFYSSGFVVDESRSREARLMAAKIMLTLDLVPRICMSLMLTVGGVLSELKGIAHPSWQLAAIVLLGPVWLSMVLAQHFVHGASWMPTLVRFDKALRWLLIGAIVGSVVVSVSTDRLGDAPWLSAKLLGFAFLVFCGLMIRRHLPDYVGGYASLLAGEPTPHENAAMQASVKRMRPWVLAIWAVLVLEAWLGIAQPSLFL